MYNSIAYCGLNCKGCKIYLASGEADPVKKEKMIYEIIDMCNTHYGVEYKFEDFTNCDGCRTTGGSLFSECANCKIRRCVIKKGLENCSYCEEYVCDNLLKIYKSDPAAKTRLDLLRGII